MPRAAPHALSHSSRTRLTGIHRTTLGLTGNDHAGRKVADIGDVGEGVRHVGAPERQEREPPGRDPVDDNIAENTRHLRGAGAEVVARTQFSHPDAALSVQRERVGPHLVPQPALVSAGSERRLLGHRGVNLSVPIEVADDDQASAAALGRGEDGGRDRWPVCLPGGVARGVDGVDDGRCAGRELGQAVGILGVSRNDRHGTG